ncbi:phage major capsid protein [Stenotrophomonas maltophilia]|uniref:phage major capsid protein n=1 Tax=Stenotrophomonas maltophilia TaxID=40324 RepID=UPI002B1E4954|nr:phage major capsid protein [Stenotrophomonas maltophilia]
MSKKTSKTAQQRAADVLSGIAARGVDGVLRRSAEVVAVDAEARTVELAFSSDAEVSRWFGVEILSHAAGACDLSRLNDGGALLWNHVWDDQRGVVVRAWIDADGKGRALVRLSKNQAGEELLIDIADGIKRHVSVGYFIRAVKLTEEREGVDVYTVTSWEPYEISIVSVPADTTVGVGRNAAEAATVAITAIDDAKQTANVPRVRAQTNITEENETRMNVKILRDASGNLVRAKVDESDAIVEVLEVLERAGDAVNQATRNGESTERTRVRELTDLASQYGSNIDGAETMLRDALAGGTSATAFQRSLLEKLNERASKPIAEQIARNDIGLSDKEQRSYSVLRLVRAQLDPTDKAAQRAAAFEMEVSQAARQAYGKDTDRAVIPTDILRQSVYGGGERAPFSSGKTGGATGGYSIATDLHAQSFIEILRNRSTFMSMARVLGGLVGNVDIPKQIAAASSFWLGAEDDELEETGTGLDQIALSPKTIGSFSEITRKLLMQSSLDVEAMVRADLAIAAGLGIDKAGYYGTGLAGQPLGIANLTGVHAVPFAVAGKPTFAELVALETEIAADNADVQSMALVANARFRGHAKTSRKFPDAVDGGTIWEPGNTVNGYRTEITNQIADGDVFFGNYGDTIVGLWGGLELAVDPYTHSRRGRIRLTAFQDVDFAHRRAESYALGRKAGPTG